MRQRPVEGNLQVGAVRIILQMWFFFKRWNRDQDAQKCLVLTPIIAPSDNITAVSTNR
jgi:hypothetical protein